jgi:hypothetical protein
MSLVQFVDAGDTQGRASAFIDAFARDGSRKYISNLTTTVRALQVDGAVVPVTVNEAEYGQAFTCLPHTAYALYCKAELDVVDTGMARPFLAAAADGMGAMLRAAKVNRIVHVNNMMMSTNLHARWGGASIPHVRKYLVEQFPSHFVAVRSVNEWTDADLMARLQSDGWRLVPSRQIFVMDDPHAEYAAHSNRRKDMRRLELLDDELTDLSHIGGADAERIAALYQALYIGKYTALNPAFTSDYIRMTNEAGVIRYRGTRDADGNISAVAGGFNDGRTMTPPVIAYDQSRPRSQGLYRTAMALSVEMAGDAGLKLNWSAGAGIFKANRGGRPVLEYNAYYDRHLSSVRRAASAALDRAVRSFIVPFVQSKGF